MLSPDIEDKGEST